MGSGAAEQIDGGGNDQLTGGASSDGLTGGTGDDTLNHVDDVTDGTTACGDGADTATLDDNAEPTAADIETCATRS